MNPRKCTNLNTTKRKLQFPRKSSGRTLDTNASSSLARNHAHRLAGDDVYDGLTSLVGIDATFRHCNLLQ